MQGNGQISITLHMSEMDDALEISRMPSMAKKHSSMWLLTELY